MLHQPFLSSEMQNMVAFQFVFQTFRKKKEKKKGRLPTKQQEIKPLTFFFTFLYSSTTRRRGSVKKQTSEATDTVINSNIAGLQHLVVACKLIS